jgi:predicted membrane protein
MTNINTTNEEAIRADDAAHRRAKAVGGLLVIVAGVLLLMRAGGYDLPHWILSWKTILIGVGIVHGVRHNFRRPGWFIMVLIGSAFLVADFYWYFNVKAVLWPLLLILLGLFIIFKPARRHRARYCRDRWRRSRLPDSRRQAGAGESFENSPAYGSPSGSYGPEGSAVNDEFIDSTTVFGGVKKNILSKNFRGGDVVSVFGGTELDLTNADFKDGVELEVTSIFGGTKLIVPANWEIKSNIVTVLGGVEDKRPRMAGSSPAKVLRLTGTTFIGGVEIVSY